MPCVARMLWLPASLNGMIASPPYSSMIVFSRVPISVQRVVPGDLLELATAFRPDPPQRVEHTVG